MARKKLIKPGETHGYIGDKPKYNKPVKVFIQSSIITEYKLQRNILLLTLYPNLSELINTDGTLI